MTWFFEIFPHFLVESRFYFCIRLLENEKFLNLQSGKKCAYLEAYMSGQGSGASFYLDV